jgi:AraC-like DNA-binding protein
MASENTVRYAPTHSYGQVVIRTAEPYHAFAVLLIPAGHLRKCANEEGLELRAELSGWTRSDPHGLARDIRRIVEEQSECDNSSFAEKDEVARRIILRILQVNGGSTPDWHDDASVFDRRTMNNLVEYIDAHLKIAPSLSDMAMLVGLSPSHFAKKFRQSTGLSFHRLINRRRIQTALESLTNPSQPLAHIALELGFSSQAHFTHVFSGLTGMTPAKYRKQFKAIVG